MIPADTRPGAVIGERFVIEELAGSGGMGEVYRARDSQTGERVAVKVLHAGAQSHVERFVREARLLSQLDHPAIVRYIAHGDARPLYLAMEWLEGEDLGRRLARGALEPREAIEMTRQVAEALDAAHRRGVVHRDIKPSNIYLCGRSISAVKLLDFGVARALGGTRAMTVSGQVLGTIGYMAPEQAREGREVRATVDVFSLGCVLFECLAGRPAFPGERLIAVLAKILFSETPRVSDVREDVPPVLDELVLRMMQRKPEDRPTVPALIAELDSIATGARLRELRPRPRAPRRVEDEPAIGHDEQRLMALVVAEDGLSGRPSSSSPTLSLHQIHLAADELLRAVAPFGGRAEMLSNGSQIIALTGSGAATDLAVRAARCALALRRLLPRTAMCVAMGRGDPSGPRIGEVATRAERLLELSTAAGGRPRPQRGGIRIDQAMAGLLDARFEISGDDESLELLGERERGEPVRHLLGKPAPFVGRARELATIEAALDECVTERVATAVVVTAPDGAGKSRLWHELSRKIDERDVEIAVWSARGDPIAPGSSFGLMAQLVRSLAGLVAGEQDEVRRHKLTARVGRHLAASEVPRVAEFLGEIVGADYPDERRTALRAARQDGVLMGEQMLRAWEDFVRAECAAAPVLVVLEDLHWGDLPTVRFIDAALRAARSSPLMVLALARPEVSELFPDLFSERRVQSLRLPELTPRAAEQLIAATLGDRVSRETAEALAARAGGNPLYLEELIRAVADGRGGELPETVLAMAQARLEQLPPHARRVLRAASVFGRSFWIGGVAALLGAPRDEVAATLNELSHREIVARSAVSRFSGEEELAFRHALIRDAAYGTLTERDAQLGHKAAGAWLEAAGERDAIVMAEHLERGGEPGGAVVWYLWAAEQALEGNDFAAVVARAERGIACGASGSVLGELLLLQSEALGWGASSREHARLAAEARVLLPPETSAHARAAAELAVASARLGDAARLRTAAESLQPADATLGVAHAIAIARTVIELYAVGRAAWAEPLALAVESGSPAFEDEAPILEVIREWLEAARALFAGRPERYLAQGDALVAALEAHGQLRCAVLAEHHVAMALARVGAYAEAVERAQATIERASRMGLVTYVESARVGMAAPLARLGTLPAAEALADRCLEAALASADSPTEARARASLAAIRAWRGDPAGAERTAREVVTRGDFPPDARVDAAATLTSALVARGAIDEALAAAEQGLALASHGVDARLWLAHADALAASGAADRSRAALREAARAITERAEAIAEPRWRAAFLAVPEHRAILERAADEG